MKNVEVEMERRVGDARIIFTSVAIFLQLAALSLTGVGKWVWAGFALFFLMWALLVCLTVYSGWIKGKLIRRIVVETPSISGGIAIIVTAFALIRSYNLSEQAGLGDWYVGVIVIFGSFFWLLYMAFPAVMWYKRWWLKRKASQKAR